MKVVNTFTVPASVDRVGAALISESFNMEVENDRPEVLSTRFVVEEESAERKVFEVRSVEYKRKKTGGLDKSGTVNSVNRNVWDAGAHTLSWSYRGVGDRWVQIGGTYHLAPDGGGTRVNHEVDVEVNIPLVGKTVAKYIAGELGKATDRFQVMIVRHLPPE